MGSHFLRKILAEHRKQQFREALEPGISAAQAAAQSAERAAQSAKNAAQAAEKSAESLREALKRVTSDNSGAGSPRRFLTLLIVCLLLLVGAIIASSFVPAAFTDPAIGESYPGGGRGTVQVRIADSRTSQSGKAAVNSSELVHILAEYSLDHGSDVFYLLWFPKYLVGEKFVLVLSDGARMRHVSTSGISLVNNSGNCEFSSRYMVPQHVSSPCQFLYGIVPLPSSSYGQVDCSMQGARPADYTSVLITGQTIVTGDIDWAHQFTNLPAVGSVDRRFFPQNLRGRFTLISQNACSVLQRNYNWQLGDMNPAPSETNQYFISWTGQSAAEGVTVISKNSGAEGLANVLIVVAGTLAAVVIALASPTYQAWSEWRRKSSVKLSDGCRD